MKASVLGLLTATIIMLMRVIMMGCGGGCGCGRRRRRGSCVRCCGLVMGGKMAALALCLSTHVALAGESVIVNVFSQHAFPFF